MQFLIVTFIIFISLPLNPNVTNRMESNSMEANHAIRFEFSNRTQSNSQKKLNNSMQSKVRMTSIRTIGFDDEFH